MAGPMGGPMGPRGFLTDEEKQSMPKVSWTLIKRILSYLKPYWFQFLLVFLEAYYPVSADYENVAHGAGRLAFDSSANR